MGFIDHFKEKKLVIGKKSHLVGGECKWCGKKVSSDKYACEECEFEKGKGDVIKSNEE
jgi:uncharacterized OB-fold protein